MAVVINRATLELRTSANEIDYPEPVWKWNPDLTAVAGVPFRYWKPPADWDAVGAGPEVQTAGEQAATDAALLAAARDDLTGRVDDIEDILRAALLAILDEFNVVRGRAYGGLYRDAAVTSQTIPNNEWTQLDALAGSAAMPVGDGVIADTSAGVITLPKAGDWLVSWGLSFSGSANSDFEFAVFGNSTAAAGTSQARALGSGSAAGIGSVGTSSIVTTPVPGIDVSLRVRHGEGTSKDVTVERVQLLVLEVTDLADRTIAQLRTVVRNKLGM